MKKVVVFSGAGISAESGLKTFRDSDGLWENYKIEDVATFDAWKKDPKLVLDFYNERRKQVLKSKPNNGHFALTKLEEYFDLQIITQNIDDLHERAGSKNILHLHGEILFAKSTLNNKRYPVKGEKLNLGDFCQQNTQLRPDIVWFGEPVPNMIKAEEICENTDILIVVGTSLTVYPAANILNFVPNKCKIYIIDPNNITLPYENCIHIQKKASVGIPTLANILVKEKTT